jgi:hypothetical protein
MKNLLRQMLQIDEDKRLSIPELIAHEYLNGVKDN